MGTNQGQGGGAKRGVGETRLLVLRHTKKGLGPREVALLTGITTQAVYQHLAALRASGELEEEVAS